MSNLIESSFEILDQDHFARQIERAGRVCYKSEDKIGSFDKCFEFVNRLISNKHYAMLEHGTIYLVFPRKNEGAVEKYKKNPYSRVVSSYGDYYVTTNYRVIIENGWEEDLSYAASIPREPHQKRVTVHFTFDIGVGREVTRHRVFSFAQESTRYCNYCKEKFGGSIVAVEPEWYKNTDNEEAKKEFEEAIDDANRHYNKLIGLGLTPQDARCVLPLATKSDLVMTGYLDDWAHFFDLRSSRALTGAPHPDMKVIGDALLTEFENRHLL